MDSWRPWSSLVELQRFRRDFENTISRLVGGEATAEEEETIEPAADCFVEQGKFFVRIDLPGVDPADIDVKATDGALTVVAKRKEEQEKEEREFIERELPYGTFERTIELPEGVQVEAIRAAYKNGVLELTVPIEAAKEKEVKIRVEPGSTEAK